jgi:hypothetical protein
MAHRGVGAASQLREGSAAHATMSLWSVSGSSSARSSSPEYTSASPPFIRMPPLEPSMPRYRSQRSSLCGPRSPQSCEGVR